MNNTCILIFCMSLTTILVRFIPFLLFHDENSTPPFIRYLGRVLPAAVIGMLVVYCLRDTVILSSPWGIPELAASLVVVILQAKTHKSLISILSGTLTYMLLIHIF